MQYLYIRPVHTDHIYGLYVRVHFLTPVLMGRMYGCWKMHPYIRAVHMGHMYRCIFRHPYVQAIPTARMYGPCAYRPLVAKAVLKVPACCGGYVAFCMHMMLLYFSVSSWRKLWTDDSVVASETHSFIVYMRQEFALYVTFLQEIKKSAKMCKEVNF